MSTVIHLKLQGNHMICKNQDVIYEGVYVYSNQRGVRKTAAIMPPAAPASWVSIYGSLTVTQVGKEYPNGGMNEAGLVVEQTTLWQTEYPDPAGHPVLNELQWIQYMLDTCRTVPEVLQAASQLRIGQNTSKLHYVIADRTGDCTILEFVDGNMLVHREPLPLPVLANTPYLQAVEEIQADTAAWPEWDDYARNSMERILQVTRQLDSLSANEDVVDFGFDPLQARREDTIDFGFDLLQAARREDTVFSLVYDQQQLTLHACTARYPQRKLFRLADFDFAAGQPSHAADLQLLGTGAAREQFVPYSTEFNLRAVRGFFEDPLLTSVFQWQISEEMIQFLGRYPENLEETK
ncbi:linear amide C-N hydrolase [Paenibacillus donghaensis]|uniref:Choloylglycine hydrolase/NAAA C-terminal domain-containing protein n=1 Tax=Paenibacillus donghaensis TaxID=414771 RepID=A0A2Z2KU36_9BACL|nr:linear amide C-N hydrolase [Paenibacillus donghaensis]ASA25532.1 hypothetical protein B9T62_35255 [Paenibacillus donghaensis]